MTAKTDNIGIKTHPKPDIIDYRGDCWQAYQDVSLCLRILPPGKSFEFILEKEKYDNIKKVIAYNGGEILAESSIDEGIYLKVSKVSRTE